MAAGFGWRSKGDELKTGIEERSGRGFERHCCDPFFCDLRNDTGEDEGGRGRSIAPLKGRRNGGADDDCRLRRQEEREKRKAMEQTRENDSFIDDLEMSPMSFARMVITSAPEAAAAEKAFSFQFKPRFKPWLTSKPWIDTLIICMQQWPRHSSWLLVGAERHISCS